MCYMCEEVLGRGEDVLPCMSRVPRAAAYAAYAMYARYATLATSATRTNAAPTLTYALLRRFLIAAVMRCRVFA
jgi:hypothetical protein